MGIDIRNQCVRSKVAFFFRQWGGGRRNGSRLLEGREWSQLPKAPSRSPAQYGLIQDMTDLPCKFDEIGIWSELKLVCSGNTALLTRERLRAPQKLKKYYMTDSAARACMLRKNRAEVEGSPTIALKVQPRFDAYCFLVSMPTNGYLRTICGDRQDIDIHTGTQTEYMAETVTPAIQYKKFTRLYAFSTLTGYTLTGNNVCRPDSPMPWICF